MVFEKLFCSNIMHICFGEDVSDKILIETDFRNKEKTGPAFIRKKVFIGAAIDEFDESVM